MKTFKEIVEVLARMGLLNSYVQKGEPMGVDEIAINSMQSEPYHKLMVVHPGEQYNKSSLMGRITLMIPVDGSMDLNALRHVIEGTYGTAPFQLLRVLEKDLTTAEEAIRKFLADELNLNDLPPLPESFHFQTSDGDNAYVQKVNPKESSKGSQEESIEEARAFIAEKYGPDEHIELPSSTYDGHRMKFYCPFCNTQLPYERTDKHGCSFYVYPCSCPRYKAAREHNDKL